MSLFDAIFEGGATAQLLDYFGSEVSVAIELAGTDMVAGATGLKGPERTEEEHQDDQILKVLHMELAMKRGDLDLPHKGLDRNITAAIAIVDDIRWNIEGIDNRTSTWVVLKLVRRTFREGSVSGFRRAES